MKRSICFLTAAFFAGVTPFASGADKNPLLEMMQGGEGIHQASDDDVAYILNNVNKPSEFVTQIACEFVPTRGVTVGHTVDASGKYQPLDITPTIKPLKVEIGQWTNGGELENLTDVRMSTHDKTVRELNWILNGHEQPAGHPALIVNWTATQNVNGRPELLQEHRLMIATNYSPTAPAYYTQTHPMKAGDEAAKRTMSVTVLSGSCTFAT
jgi:hypothetical protein